MRNLVKLIEIPATDFARAVKFYETVIGHQTDSVCQLRNGEDGFLFRLYRN